MIRFETLTGRQYTIARTAPNKSDYDYVKILYKTEPSFLGVMCIKLIPFAQQLEGLVIIKSKDQSNIDITWCNTLGEIMARTCTPKDIYSLLNAPATPRLMADYMYMRGVFKRV